MISTHISKVTDVNAHTNTNILFSPVNNMKPTRPYTMPMCNIFPVVPVLNETLVSMLLDRDDLHMEQDSMLVDIEDLTRYL
jgi:hypothetical protein